MNNTDWLRAERLSSLMQVQWNISAITQEAASILMQEEYESLYKIIRLKMSGSRSKEPMDVDYPVNASAGQVAIPLERGFHTFQLQLLIFNSSNVKLHIAHTPGAQQDRDPDCLPFNFSYFTAYTDYGDELF